jgi:hypothetical protein
MKCNVLLGLLLASGSMLANFSGLGLGLGLGLE